MFICSKCNAFITRLKFNFKAIWTIKTNFIHHTNKLLYLVGKRGGENLCGFFLYPTAITWVFMANFSKLFWKFPWVYEGWNAHKLFDCFRAFDTTRPTVAYTVTFTFNIGGCIACNKPWRKCFYSGMACLKEKFSPQK